MSRAPAENRIYAWLAARAHRADAYFLSPVLREADATEVAQTRMGLLLLFGASLGTICFLPLQFVLWSRPIALATLAIALLALAIPFLLKQRPAMRHAGQLTLGALALASAGSIWMSSGQAVGILPFLPVLPMLGLLVGGARSALIWSGAALLIAGMGALMVATGRPPSAGYAGSSLPARYLIATICVLGICAIAQLFNRFWNRTAREIADRAQAELAAREERSRSLLEHASEGVMVVDAAAVVKFASPAADRLVDVEPGGSMGHRLRDFTVEEDFVRCYPLWQEVIREPNAVAHLQLTTRPNRGRGEPADARVLDLAVTNHLSNPAVEGIIVRMRDVTELARAEANYQTLVENSLQGIAIECDGRIVYANQALADLFRIPREALLSAGDADALVWVHEDDRGRVQDAYEGGDPGPLEMRLQNAQGEWRCVQMRWSPASWKGHPARQIAYADITAEKALEASRERENERLAAAVAARTLELQASQDRLREQERMATVGTLAAGIAHQINNPVGAILTSADFAILMADEEDGEEIRSDALADIRAEAIRCGKIVRSVLQFARAEPTEKWSSDLTSVVRTAVDVTQRYATDRGARIDVELDPLASVRSTVMNPIELEQVFVNLIRNAIESNPSGARVLISTRLVANDEILVAIEDDGPGVREEHVGKLFDPFYTTRLQQGGTGLGLSVAHGIVVDHGGRMWLDRRGGLESATAPGGPPTPSGSGARFNVLLPTEKSKTPS